MKIEQIEPIGELVTPRIFTDQQQFPFLQVGDFSCIEYKHCSNQYKNRVIVTTSLFVVVLSGEKIIHTLDGDLSVSAGQAFFARKGSYLFSEVRASQDEFRTLVFYIDDSFLEQFLSRYTFSFGCRLNLEEKDLFKVSVSPLLEMGIGSILPYFRHKTEFTPQLLRLKLEELLLHILGTDTDGNFAGFLQMIHSSRKRELRVLLDNYFTKPVTVEELAKLSGRSLSAFKREFREIFHDSPRHWITNRRLEYARMLLTTSEDTVSDVCLLAGFDNFSHFSQIFKKKFGIPPSKVQKIRN